MEEEGNTAFEDSNLVNRLAVANHKKLLEKCTVLFGLYQYDCDKKNMINYTNRTYISYLHKLSVT